MTWAEEREDRLKSYFGLEVRSRDDVPGAMGKVLEGVLREGEPSQAGHALAVAWAADATTNPTLNLSLLSQRSSTAALYDRMGELMAPPGLFREGLRSKRILNMDADRHFFKPMGKQIAHQQGGMKERIGKLFGKRDQPKQGGYE